jgi:hypothetical protein
LETAGDVATLRTMATDPHTKRLLDRIRKLVAEQRRMDDDDSDDRRAAKRREIARLQWRLANAVKRELSPGPGLRPVLALRLR